MNESNWIIVFVLVEGQTELIFVKQILAPHLEKYCIQLVPTFFTKKGQSGGDVKFARAKNDIRNYLNQQRSAQLTLLVDYYGIKSDWPGYAESKREKNHRKKFDILTQKTAEEVKSLFPNSNDSTRFIPYVSMYEIEALYFSDPCRLAEKLGIKREKIDAIIHECKEPEQINDSSETTPSKRLEKLSKTFRKTDVINIAEYIGLETMRSKCPLFSAWVTQLENLKSKNCESQQSEKSK